MVSVPPRTVVVAGATSPVGDFLLPRLVYAGFRVHALSRRVTESHRPMDGVTWHQLPLKEPTPAAWALIHLAPLWVVPEVLDALSGAGLGRLIAFGSTSLFTKQASVSEKERALSQRLVAAERVLQQRAELAGIYWTLFRPTLVYGTGRDQSITTMRRVIRRWGIFPLAGPGKGLRQPVHADDLAKACIDCLDNTSTFNQAYNLAGGEVLSFADMLDRIAQAEGKRLRSLRIPRGLFALALAGARLLPRYRHLDRGMLDRTEQDLVFDISDAIRDFGYSPRGFSGRDSN